MTRGAHHARKERAMVAIKQRVCALYRSGARSATRSHANILRRIINARAAATGAAAYRKRIVAASVIKRQHRASLRAVCLPQPFA